MTAGEQRRDALHVWWEPETEGMCDRGRGRLGQQDSPLLVCHLVPFPLATWDALGGPVLCRKVALGLAPESDGARQLRQGLGGRQAGHCAGNPLALSLTPIGLSPG